MNGPDRKEHRDITRRELAERAIQLAIVGDPKLAAAVLESVAVERLSDQTREIAGIALEFSALCAMADLFSVAAFINTDPDILELIDNLGDLPEWVKSLLPTLSVAIQIIGPPRIEKIGAVDLWRIELASGRNGQIASRPTTWRLDKLWESACREMSALELARSGDYRQAALELSRAAKLLIESERSSQEAA